MERQLKWAIAVGVTLLGLYAGWQQLDNLWKHRPH